MWSCEDYKLVCFIWFECVMYGLEECMVLYWLRWIDFVLWVGIEIGSGFRVCWLVLNVGIFVVGLVYL